MGSWTVGDQDARLVTVGKLHDEHCVKKRVLEGRDQKNGGQVGGCCNGSGTGSDPELGC